MSDQFDVLDAPIKPAGGDKFAALDSGPTDKFAALDTAPEPKPNPTVAGADLYDPSAVGIAAKEVAAIPGKVGNALAHNALSDYFKSRALSQSVSKVPIVGHAAHDVVAGMEPAAAAVAKGAETGYQAADKILSSKAANFQLPYEKYVGKPIGEALSNVPVVGKTVLQPGVEALSTFAQSMATPKNAVIGAILPEANPLVQRAVAAIFAYKGGEGTYQEAKEAYEALKTADIPSTTRHMIAALLNLGTAVGGAAGAIGGFPEAPSAKSARLAKEYAEAKAAADQATIEQFPPGSAYSAPTGEEFGPQPKQGLATGEEQGPGYSSRAVVVRKPAVPEELKGEPAPLPPSAEHFQTPTRKPTGALEAPVSPFTSETPYTPPMRLIYKGDGQEVTSQQAPDPLDLVWSAREKKISQEAEDYKTRGSVLDALNRGAQLEPETLSRFFGKLPDDVAVLHQTPGAATGEAFGPYPMAGRSTSQEYGPSPYGSPRQPANPLAEPTPVAAAPPKPAEYRITERTPNGDLVQELPKPPQPDLAASAAVLKRYNDGSDDVNAMMTKLWHDYEGQGKFTVERTQGVSSSETKFGKDGKPEMTKIKIGGDGPEEPIFNAYHEFALHAPLKDGYTLFGDIIAHDDGANPLLARKLIEEGMPSYSGQPMSQAAAGKRVVAVPGLPTPVGQSPGFLKRMIGITKVNPKVSADVYENYSTVGKFREKVDRNMVQTEMASPDAATALRGVVTANQTARLALDQVKKTVAREITPDPMFWENAKIALLESNLRAKEARFRDFADNVRKASPQQLQQYAPDLIALMKDKIANSAQFRNPKLAEQAQQLYDAGDMDKLRPFLASFYDAAADKVGTAQIPGGNVAGFRRTPQYKQFITIYDGILGKLFAMSQVENEGILSNAIGDAYYPGIALDAAGDPIQRSTGISKVKPMAQPLNPNNFFSTGHGEGYDPSDDALVKAATVAAARGKRFVAHGILHDEGWEIPFAQGTAAPTSIPDPTQPGKNAMASQSFDIKPIEGTDATGKKVVYDQAVMPQFMYNTVGPLLDKKYYGSTIDPIWAVTAALNKVQLAGVGDAAIHGANLISVATMKTPIIGDSLVGKMVGNLPFTKSINVIAKILAEDPTTPDNQARIIRMSQNGQLPTRFGTETGKIGNLLYGEKGLDIKARLWMDKIAEQMNPDITPQQRYEWTASMGNYVSDLQGIVERSLKKSGLSPFYTAGSTMLKEGVKAWLGGGKLPFDSQTSAGAIKARIGQQLTAGAVGTVAGWMVAHKALTGKWPQDDPDSRFLMLPVPEEIRNSAVGKALWGDKEGTAFVAYGQPLLTRGANATGIDPTFNTLTRGGTLLQAIERASAVMFTGLLHPAVGPVPRDVWTGLTGKGTGIANFGKSGPEFYSEGKREDDTLGAAAAQRAKAVFMHTINPTIDQAAKIADHGDWLGRLLQWVPGAPRTNVYNTDAEADRLSSGR